MIFSKLFKSSSEKRSRSDSTRSAGARSDDNNTYCYCLTCSQAFLQIKQANIHKDHRVMQHQECQSKQCLQLNQRVHIENSYQIFQALSNHRLFPNLKNLDLKFSGCIFTWMVYKPDPKNPSFCVWDNVCRLKELSYDLSEINLNSEWLEIMLRGFKVLAKNLETFHFNLFHTQLNNSDIVGVLEMLQEFKRLSTLTLNLRRVQKFNFNDPQFLQQFDQLLADLPNLQHLTINISQVQDNNHEESLEIFTKSLCKKQLISFGLSMRNSQVEKHGFENILKCVQSQTMLQELTLDLSYNPLTEGFVQELAETIYKLTSLKKVNIVLDGCSMYFNNQDLLVIKEAGIYFLNKLNKSFSFIVPIQFKKQYLKIQRIFDNLQAGGFQMWQTLKQSKISKVFRKEIVDEILIDFLYNCVTNLQLKPQKDNLN